MSQSGLGEVKEVEDEVPVSEFVIGVLFEVLNQFELPFACNKLLDIIAPLVNFS